jgi:hypothetical protein
MVRVGDARPPPFTILTIPYKVVVYAPDERVDTLPLFLLYPYMYSVNKTTSQGGPGDDALSMKADGLTRVAGIKTRNS